MNTPTETTDTFYMGYRLKVTFGADPVCIYEPLDEAPIKRCRTLSQARRWIDRNLRPLQFATKQGI